MVWCPYCGEPLFREGDYVKSWIFQSPKGGAVFRATIYKCHRPKCGRKVRIVEKETI